MVSKRTLLSLVITSLVLIALLHSVFHFVVYGTSIPGFYQKGLSGFSIGKMSLGEEFKKQYPAVSPISKIALIAEWSLLLLLIIFSFVRARTNTKKEQDTIKLKDKYTKGENKTDLDTLYEVLKEKKRLSLKTIAKMFNVKKEIAQSWCETLESGGLATLHYPRIGDPEIVIAEDE